VIIPLRGADTALTFSWDLDALIQRYQDLNRTLEETWASLLSVLIERWPDWPVEIWGSLHPIPDPETPSWRIEFLVSVGGAGPDDRHVATVVRFLTEGVAKLISVPPLLQWSRIGVECKPLWLVDDGQIHRVLAPEGSVEKSVYLLGHYAGEPAWFAATIEAWPLHGTGLKVALTDVDLSWAFEP